MPRQVTLELGKGGSHLSNRSLVIRDVSVVPTDVAHVQSLAGTTETASFQLPDNGLWEAELIDTSADGTVGLPTVIKFSTFDGNQFQSGALSILSWDEISESSASSASSLSTSSSVSSSSTSTLSSSSSHSRSSSSLSSSSVSSSSKSSLSSLSSSSVSSLSSSSSRSSSSTSSLSSSSSLP